MPESGAHALPPEERKIININPKEDRLREQAEIIRTQWGLDFTHEDGQPVINTVFLARPKTRGIEPRNEAGDKVDLLAEFNGMLIGSKISVAGPKGELEGIVKSVDFLDVTISLENGQEVSVRLPVTRDFTFNPADFAQAKTKEQLVQLHALANNGDQFTFYIPAENLAKLLGDAKMFPYYA